MLIISPLTALVKDQQQYLSSHNISSCVLCEEANSEFGSFGHTSVIFASPEALNLPRTRHIVQHKVTNLCLVVYDECHCVSKW